MKIALFLAALLMGASLMSVSYAGTGKDNSVRWGEKSPVADKIAEAVRRAQDPKSSVEYIAEAVAAAIDEGASPSDVLARVLDARSDWNTDQVSFLYKTVVNATPGLSSSLAQDIKDYINAGKPITVPANSPEGIKILAIINGAHVDLDSVISNIVIDSTGVIVVVPVPPLRDVQPADPHPVVPTPPVVSGNN